MANAISNFHFDYLNPSLRCQCCLGLTDSRPCPTPPSLGTFYIITLFFLQSLFVFDQRRPQGWESKSAFLSARFLNCTTESVEQFCLHLLLYTDVTNSQHHTTWVLEFYDLWSLLYVEYVDLTKWEGEKVKCLYRFQYTDVTNNTSSQQSTPLFSLEFYINLEPFLPVCVILMNLVRTFLPSFYNSQL